MHSHAAMKHDRSAGNDAFIAPGPLLLATMILLAAFSRLLPLPPNFAPIEAMALFAGAYFSRRWLALATPLLALALSDIVLGLVRGDTYLQYFTTASYLPSIVANYLCVVLTVALASGLRGRVSGLRVLGYSLAGSVLFFLVSNFAVWATAFVTPGYPACGQGLLPCYVAAIPFFKNTLLGTLFYSALLFGSFALLRGRIPLLRRQTV